MLVCPPGPQILGSINPRLAIVSVRDGRANLIDPVGWCRVIPVEALSALDVAAQIVEISGRQIFLGVQVIEAVAPVSKGEVIIDTDEIDIIMRP